jgi:acetyl esterase/lipase
MMSEEAEAAIKGLAAEKAARNKNKGQPDPGVVDLESIFRERAAADTRARGLPVPDRLTLSYETADGIQGEWLKFTDLDAGKLKNRIILFVHGGGFNTGSALSRRALAGKLALHAKADSFSINYRLCPEYKFPAALDDCVTAYVWLLKKGYKPHDIVLFGESAGGNLVLSMVHFLKDHYLPLPRGVCAFSPVVELTSGLDSRVTRANRDVMLGPVIDEDRIPATLELFRQNKIPILPLYCSAAEGESPYASPLRGDFSGFPRLMIQAGSEEMLYDDAVEIAGKARRAGVEVTLHIWEGLFHVFALFDSPETEAVCEEIGRFIRHE